MASNSVISTDPGQLSLDKLCYGHPLAVARLRQMNAVIEVAIRAVVPHDKRFASMAELARVLEEGGFIE